MTQNNLFYIGHRPGSRWRATEERMKVLFTYHLLYRLARDKRLKPSAMRIKAINTAVLRRRKKQTNPKASAKIKRPATSAPTRISGAKRTKVLILFSKLLLACQFQRL